MSEAEKRERVCTVISALGLDACKDTIVGGFFRKGISGGERKRCSVGHELLINPSLLLLDEPTSGTPNRILWPPYRRSVGVKGEGILYRISLLEEAWESLWMCTLVQGCCDVVDVDSTWQQNIAMY